MSKHPTAIAAAQSVKAIPSDSVSEVLVEDIEIELLLQGLYRAYGFDFRDYSRASLKRRIMELMRTEKLETVSAFQNRVLHDPVCLQRLLLGLSVHATAMFRDPSF